ncbi:type I restriction endonuclease [Rubrivirga sp. S365]|uniref:Type I restriction endonuclease n=1 Tax=Rubrivirga litoralis TaxID=3075598 RepID=A0ABU3BMU7_9BACT|nr:MULTISPECIES: type I restriction endonuclease [unclassified Rubrivirga]MDT0630603.1 type I restriction endonuclease [Rubrivirga sp. F394]MDT7857684.1 type I restriction endonuclease [Rubrivirga sp. S365]
MSLRERLDNARDLLQSGRLANEASVSGGVVLPILDGLGWPVFDPSVVAPEYSVEKRRVDYALITNGTPAVFVEVKQPGLANGADRQLFEYAFHEGVPIAILTDGVTWHVYLPAMQGSYDERRVYLLDLLERDPDESVERLERYLSREAVESGEAFERARKDYQRAKQRKGAAEAIPQAWANLLADPETPVVSLLTTEVERVSGFEAEPKDLHSFLAALRPRSGSLPKPKTAVTKRRTRSRSASGSATSTPLPGTGYAIDGEFVGCRRGHEVIEGVFKTLASRDSGFPERFAEQVRGKKRAYLARSKADLFPGHPELEGQSAEIAPGWFLSTQNSSEAKKRLIEKACRLASLEFGKDVEVQMP